jgi:hypothetical protein
VRVVCEPGEQGALMKLDALDHPKTLDFAARLGVSRPTAIGHLELLWAFVGKIAPQGNIGKFADGAIARSSEWQGDPAVFIDALLDAGFLDEDPEHRLLVHDWHDHCPRWVSAKLKKLGITFSVPTAVTSTVATAVATTVPSPCARASPGEGKAGEGKRVRTHAPVPTAERTEPEGNGETPDPHALVEAIKAVYPAGTYGQQNWILAERELSKLLDGGASPEELLAHARAFAAQMLAKGSIGTQFIRSPEKFFGDGFWRGPFPIPVAGKPAGASLTWRPDPDEERRFAELKLAPGAA